MSLSLICLAIWLRDLMSSFDCTANIQLHIFYIKDDSFVHWQNFHLLIFHLHLSKRERCHSLSGLWHWLVSLNQHGTTFVKIFNKVEK